MNYICWLQDIAHIISIDYASLATTLSFITTEQILERDGNIGMVSKIAELKPGNDVKGG